MKVNLKKWLAQAGITQKQLAAEIDVSFSTVSVWCRKETVPHYMREKVATSLAKYREPRKPKTILRKKSLSIPMEPVTKLPTFWSKTDIDILKQLIKVPTDNDTKFNLIDCFVSSITKRASIS